MRLLEGIVKVGWLRIHLSKSCLLFTDGNWIETKDQSPNGIRLIQTGNIGNGEFKDRRNKARFISSKTFDRLKCQEVSPGDCLISRLPDPVGRSCIIPDTGDKMITAVDCSILRFADAKLLSDFFCYYSQSSEYLTAIEHKCTGATRKRISRKNLGQVEIPLPPLPEQKRIVAILDEAFAGISQAVANAEKNLANARELFESYLNNVFTRKGDGWVEMPLSSACVVERGSSPRPIKSYLTDAPDGVNWVKIGDTKGVVKFINSTKQKITKEGAERSRRVDPDDFILTNSMSFGRPYIMATSGYIHDGWFVLRLEKSINTNFFYYLLSSRLVQDQFHTLAAGAVVKNISSDLVKKAILPMPPLSEQEELVESIESLISETHHLEFIYQKKLESLAELKQSILQKAFRGELTADVAPQPVN